MKTRMELLAPAGGMRELKAAVGSGADAVYMGAAAFSARAGAGNFTEEEMREAVRYAHTYGVKVHCAINTLIKENEFCEAVSTAVIAAKCGVDALIIQDIGFAGHIRKVLPDIELHASTQMTVTSLEGVRYLEKMGFSRVVLARELSLSEIEYIAKNAKAEIEVFVHGAICVCYSGQCLMSSILGGRSGNRGRCAQPCRLPYELTEGEKICGSGYILSPKDMALIKHLDKLRKAGVASLKIEGRLKSAEYVSAVVGVYRKYLDSDGEVTDEDMAELKNAFSRSGIARNICRVRQEKEIKTTKQLVEIIENSIPKSKQKDGHPAKRSFQAIRIEVNNEIKPLYQTVKDCIDSLKIGGRLCIITFHSLEDRAVKNAYLEAKGKCICPSDLPYCTCGAKSLGKIITKKPIIATQEEQNENSRSKSAKLRIFEKTI